MSGNKEKFEKKDHEIKTIFVLLVLMVKTFLKIVKIWGYG